MDSGATHHGTDANLPTAGGSSHRRRLTAAQVVDIFKHKAIKTDPTAIETPEQEHLTSVQLSEKHGVTPQTIREIWNLKRFATETRPFWTSQDAQTYRGLKINHSEFPTSIKHISLESRVEVIFLYEYLQKVHYGGHIGIVRGVELKDVGIVRKIYAPSPGKYLVYVELENEVASQDLRIIWGRRPQDSKMPFPTGTSENFLVVRPQHLRPLL